MKKAFFSLVLFFLTTINTFLFASADYSKITSQIVSKFSQRMANQRALYLIGKGGRMMTDVKVISLHFVSTQNLELEDARKLYIEVLEDFLQVINQNDKIRPYLHNYPFTQKNIELMIGFRDKNFGNLANNCVSLMFIVKDDIIYYETLDPESDSYKTLHSELYETAKEIVFGQSTQITP